MPIDNSPIIDSEFLNKKFPLCTTGPSQNFAQQKPIPRDIKKSTNKNPKNQKFVEDIIDSDYYNDELAALDKNPMSSSENSENQSDSKNQTYSTSRRYTRNRLTSSEKRRRRLSTINAQTLINRESYLKSISHGAIDNLFEIRKFDDFVVPRYHKSIITAEGIILLSGGFENEQPTKQCFLFDVINGKMSTIEPMNHGRTGHA